ncbi:hypothetical protein [Streptomyces sp. STR69]|uniref:hypothetical protein n=1 Tax=Streptomyces sp. STR69 TaxID=1796942 RepID=UPI0021C9C7D8|nr:hypothetical protein [Streptomyces sp. STR69]
MLIEEPLEQQPRHVRYLRCLAVILGCVFKRARGHSSLDTGALTAAYHVDGFGDRGHAVELGSACANWANKVHVASPEQHTYNITNDTCGIDSATAHCESYVLVALLGHGPLVLS